MLDLTYFRKPTYLGANIAQLSLAGGNEFSMFALIGSESLKIYAGERKHDSTEPRCSSTACA
jgi:hypothetical protein